MAKVNLSRVYQSSLDDPCKFAVNLKSFPQLYKTPQDALSLQPLPGLGWVSSEAQPADRDHCPIPQGLVTPASIPVQKTALARSPPGGRRSLAPSVGEASHLKDLRLNHSAHVWGHPRPPTSCKDHTVQSGEATLPGVLCHCLGGQGSASLLAAMESARPPDMLASGSRGLGQRKMPTP